MFSSRLILPRAQTLFSRNQSSKTNLLKNANATLNRNPSQPPKKKLMPQQQAPPQSQFEQPRKLVREPVVKVTPAATAAAQANIAMEEPSMNQYEIPQQQCQQQQQYNDAALEANQGYRSHFHQGHLHEFAPKIVVVGIGGGGGNAVNNMIANELNGAYTCNVLYY